MELHRLFQPCALIGHMVWICPSIVPAEHLWCIRLIRENRLNGINT